MPADFLFISAGAGKLFGKRLFLLVMVFNRLRGESVIAQHLDESTTSPNLNPLHPTDIVTAFNRHNISNIVSNIDADMDNSVSDSSDSLE